ncbi:MAG: elongation factor 4, partial [Parcubacteria group bacterium]|nr:elongation factor 4 [Parcubacteria group bacterium]
RLRREFNVSLIVTAPSIVYETEQAGGVREKIYSPVQFPEDHSFLKVYEPWVMLKIITPETYIGDIVQILHTHEGVMGASHTFGNRRISCEVEMPLRELMRNFFDELKRVSSGFASFSYNITEMREADIVRLDVLVAEEVQSAFSVIVPRIRAHEEAKKLVERLYDILPKQLFAVKIQARGLGRILSSKTLPALKKDVTGYLYGGDITRKRKLWEKQKKGKKKLKARGKMEIPHDVFLKMVKRE